jgi:hypothetical protein
MVAGEKASRDPVSEHSTAHGATERSRRGGQLVRLITACGLVLIFYTTLFPFDFVFRDHEFLGAIGRRFELSLVDTGGPIDLIRNMLLFLPIGFGIAYQTWGHGRRRRWPLLVSLVTGLGLSLIVEVLQVFLPERDPSLSDMVANGLGAFIGCLCFYFWGSAIVDSICDLVEKGKAHLSGARLAVVFGGYAILAVVASIYLQSQTGLNNWDTDFPLLLGNEQTGDRPWQGTVSEVSLTDRALSEEEVGLAFSESQEMSSVMHPLLALYRLEGDAPYRDQAGLLPDLSWHGEVPLTPNEAGILLTPKRWLETASPVTFLNDKVRETSQLTMSAVVASANMAQEGPARIISISADPFRRNLTLGQEQADLIIRLRTLLTGENGREPELIVPDVFRGSAPRHLILSYDGSNLRLFVDGLQHSYLFKLTPEVMLFKYFLPVSDWRIRLNSTAMWFYALFYYGLVFVPLGLLLGLIVALVQNPQIRAVLMVGGFLLLPLVLETSLAIARGAGVNPSNLLLSAGFLLGGLLMAKPQAVVHRQAN